MSKLAGKVALVTGGSRGIGRATALALASQGAKVAINYAGNEAAAQAVVEQILATGGDAFAVKANVGMAAEFDAAVSAVTTKWERIDILVNNAGITKDNLIMRMKEEDFDAVINTNLKGVFNGMKAVSRAMMKQRSGKIINISSVVGVMGNAGQANYVAAKAGVIGMTKTAAREFASRGITVNAIAPGFIATEMTDTLDENWKGQLLAQIPLARFGAAEDVANMVVFLASDDANYVTGQTLHVDGGMVMHG